jgi:hypothetical protein
MASVAERRNRIARVEADRVPLERRSPTLAYDVRSFGARGDGVADDTAAIQSAIDAAISGNGSVTIPGGTYRITDTLTIASCHGVIIRGAGRGSNGTLIKWDRAWVAEEYRPAVLMLGCQFVQFGDLAIYCETGRRLSRAIQIASGGGSPYVSTANTLHDIMIASNGAIDDGIYIGGYTDANNDFHVIRNVRVQQFRRYGLRFAEAATQAYDIALENFFATGYAWQETTCNATVSGATFTNIAAGTFSAEDVGAWIEVDDANFGDPGADNVLRNQITAVGATSAGSTARTAGASTRRSSRDSSARARATSVTRTTRARDASHAAHRARLARDSRSTRFDSRTMWASTTQPPDVRTKRSTSPTPARSSSVAGRSATRTRTGTRGCTFSRAERTTATGASRSTRRGLRRGRQRARQTYSRGCRPQRSTRLHGAMPAGTDRSASRCATSATRAAPRRS